MLPVLVEGLAQHTCRCHLLKGLQLHALLGAIALVGAFGGAEQLQPSPSSTK